MTLNERILMNFSVKKISKDIPIFFTLTTETKGFRYGDGNVSHTPPLFAFVPTYLASFRANAV